MKEKAVVIGSAVLLVLMAFLFSSVSGGERRVRYHQHLEAVRADTEGGTEEFSSHLPVISIETGGKKIPGSYLRDDKGDIIGFETGDQGETEAEVTLSVVDHEEGGNRPEDLPGEVSQALIRYRGNSSRHFHKKSYAVHLIKEGGKENRIGMLGMAPQNEWVLNGPFLDRTLVRNYLCYNISGEIMEYAPNVRYCELFLDGKYQGVYLLVETVSKDSKRINIAAPEDGKSETGYIVRFDRKGKGDTPIENFTYYTYLSSVSGMDVRYPGKQKITPGRVRYIEKDISRIEKSLYSFDIVDKRHGYANYVDRKAFAQYFVINEFFRNVDAGRFSTFYYKDLRGKLKPCVWDFNNACDNYIDYEWAEDGFTLPDSPWFGIMIRDPKFVEEVVSAYHRLREGVLNERYLLHYIDDTIAYLGPAVERNYEVWGYLFHPEKADGKNYLTPVERNVRSYEEAVEQLKNFIRIRGRWLDNHIETLYQYCHESKNKELFQK